MVDVVELQVGLDQRSYPIFIGAGIIEFLPDYLSKTGMPSNLVVITNHTVNALYGDLVVSILESVGSTVTVISIEDGEQYKNLETLGSIYDQLVAANVDRGSGIVALGGGVVGDIAGFAAATYLRGVPYVQIPTTLLSQVDSSVGGKTAVNHVEGKNLIGAFNQPRMVCIDIDFLQTLPEREYSAGLAEIVKYGVIRDRDFFAWLEESSDSLMQKDASALIDAIKTSCQTKADIVEIDEKESSVRAILNYGHTFGHAVEALTSYSEYLHGEAVAIGMVVAAKCSVELGYASPDHVQAIETLLRRFDLPVAVPDYSLEKYLEAMMHDKKVHGGTLRMIFNRDIGDCLIEDVKNPAQLLEKIL